ncbi:hypothetical protein [Chondrinema litorale]|uniref:hypothetical protein n=1 Tax=Chondrinema litorale TaxID=2994555 RepID=UPI002543C064|nr:hypothetical protein [Chondrinema litorale]UZR95453.1 hypothetical protein OQ292_06455 [Chondrinema litorale]
MDKLEKYIKENKESFDKLSPSNKVWQGINDSLNTAQLKGFIGENRKEFDQKEASTGLWGKISGELESETEQSHLSISKPVKETRKLVPIAYLWRLAAVFTVFLIAIVWVQFKIMNSNNNSGQHESEGMTVKEGLAQINPELSEAETYYESMIAVKKEELMQYDLVSLGLNEEFKYDLEHLDSAYTEIKNELLKGTENDLIVKALIDNLQLRMEILNRQLEILKSIKNTGQNNDDVIQI